MTTLFSSEVYASNVDTLATQVIDAAKAHGKTAKLFRAMALPAYGDLALQGQVAELLTAVRASITAKREAYCKVLARRGEEPAHFEKAVMNQVTYGTKCAGEAAGCLFVWDKSKKLYRVEDKKAANETAPTTATGKDANSAEQSKAIVEAAEKAPELTAADKAARVHGAMVALLSEGYTVADLMVAVQKLADAAAGAEAEKQAQDEAQTAKAPAILEVTKAKNPVMVAAMNKAKERA